MRGADFDTYLAAYLVKPGLGSYELETLAAERGMAEVEVSHEDRTVAEAARRAALSVRALAGLEEELEAMGLARLCYDVELARRCARGDGGDRDARRRRHPRRGRRGA